MLAAALAALCASAAGAQSGTGYLRVSFVDVGQGDAIWIQVDTTDDADGDDIYIYTDGSSLRAYEAVGPANPRRWKLMKRLSVPSGEVP